VFVYYYIIYLSNCYFNCDLLQDGQSRTVRQFQFTDWPEQGVPTTGEGFIEFIGQVHKTKEQFGQEGPITVHCRQVFSDIPVIDSFYEHIDGEDIDNSRFVSVLFIHNELHSGLC